MFKLKWVVCWFVATTNWKTFYDVKAQNLGHDKADYFTAKGTIVFMKKENCMYTVSDVMASFNVDK